MLRTGSLNPHVNSLPSRVRRTNSPGAAHQHHSESA